MALDREEVARRVRAARAYAGFEKQEDLGRLLEADGLGLHDIGRLERPHGEKAPPSMTQARVDSLSRHTGLPPEWFTEAVPLGAGDPPEEVWGEIARLRSQMTQGQTALAGELAAVRKAVGEMQQKLGQLERGEE